MRTVRVRPDGPRPGYDPPDPTLPDLQSALNAAGPDTVIDMAAGVYWTPVVMQTSGAEGRPIVVRAQPGALVDGRQTPAPLSDLNTVLRAETRGSIESVRAAMRGWWRFWDLRGVAWVEFDGLEIENCWPLAFFVDRGQHIALRRSKITGSTRVFHALGSNADGPGDFVIEGNDWTQDSSRDHDLWRRISWEDAHDGDGRHNYFNGGFFTSTGLRGPVVIRNNRVFDAFNGIRCVAGAGLARIAEQGAAGEVLGNRGFLVADNSFVRVRDNAVEPEGFARNWMICRNRLYNCYSPFSFDAVGGGYWYIHANVGWFDEKPGGGGHGIGRVLKFDMATPYPSDKVYVFHNSWYLRCPLIGDGSNPVSTRHLNFFNNAVEFCSGGAGCDLSLPAIRGLRWHGSNEFDGNLTNRASYFDYLRPLGQERNGLFAAPPYFEHAGAGRFRLGANSPARGRGIAKSIMLPDSSPPWSLPAGLDVGAYQGGELLAGPPFVSG